MAHDDGVMARELVLARLQLHRATVPTAVLSALLALAAVAFILRDIAERPLQWIGIFGLVAALAVRAGTAWAYDRRTPGVTAEVWLWRFRASYAVHGLVWMVIALRLTWLATPEEHALVIFAMTALTVGALVSTAFDWVAGAIFGGLTSVPLLLSLGAAGGPGARSELVVAVMFIAVVFLTLRRSELSLRLSVRRELDSRASAEAARRLADEADRARRALADQDRLMAQLLATTRQGCWFIDSQGITTDVNASMCTLMGLPRETLVGRPAWDFFSGTALATLQREVAKRRSGATSSYAISITRPDGTQRHCQNNASPLLDAAGQYVGSVGLWADLTEMVEATRELQVHAWAINSITDAVSVINEDATYRMVNDAWCRDTGVPREQALGASVRGLLPGVASAVRREALLACMTSNRVQVLRGPVDLPRLQGRTMQTHLYPFGGGQDQARCVVLVSRDVSAEEQVLQALQASEAEQRSLLDAFPGYITRLDSQLVYRYVNPRLATALGTTPEAMIGHTPGELFGADREVIIRDECQRALAGERVVTDRHILQAPGRPEVWAQITTAAGKALHSGELQFYAFGIDITGLHRAQLAMAEARAEAERANRAKSQFLAQMSHELRTPLNAILGFAELLDTDARWPLNLAQRGHLHEIRRGGEHLLTLINEVLELGRIEAGHLDVQAEAVALREMVGDCLTLVQPLALARPVCLLPVQADAMASHVLADPRRLRQVLLNLLGNAIKYNHAQGVVEVAWAAQGPLVEIRVRDNGPGLAPADQARAFEPFERLGARAGGVEGAGIGLALSRRLVQAMGGEIGVDSQPGHGSTFWLRLPLAAAPEPGIAPAPGLNATAPAPDVTPAARSRVLYIEDNPVNLLLMEVMLSRMPEIEARCVISPVEGLALAEADPPDLILLDLQMPVMDGFEVLRRLRAQPALCRIPVYAVSANALQLDIEAALAAGFDGYLTKPMQLDTLMATVRGALRAGRVPAAH